MRILGAVALAVLSATNALADTPIRDFDLATIEALGRHIYRQDQEAWKASDALHAARERGTVKPENARGWIVSERPGRDVVRFIQIGPDGPRSYYDVTFETDGPREMGPPKDGALTADEVAQWNARMLAVSKFEFHCTDGTPNPVAIREANGNWLVWVLTASARPEDLILAGHMRFTIAPDGKALIAADKLSKDCLVSTREPSRSGYTQVGAMFTNVVSLKPLETQIFASLNYNVPLYIGTLDGLTWKLDGGHVAVVEQDAPKPDGDVARRLFGLHEACVTLVENAAEHSQPVVGGGAYVIRQTEDSDTVQFPAPPGMHVVSLICQRLDIVPSPNDYKLLRAGYGLYIEDRGKGHDERSIVLWLNHGRIAWRFEEGPPLTPELKARIDRRCDQFQKAIDAK